MDELKQRAGEKIGALHEAAKSTVDINKSKVQDAFNQSLEAFRKIRQAFLEVWHHELIAESRARVAAWLREAKERIKEGAPPLSPILLYEELVALFKDRVWRRSMMIFVAGCAAGGCAGLALGLRLRARLPRGPTTRALHASTGHDHAVLLLEDATVPGPCAGEVLVRVQAFSVCPVDRAVLRGRAVVLRGLLARGTPLCLGRAFSGVVLDVGHGVNDLELGDEVWGCVSEWSGGAASELLTIRSTRVSKRPVNVAADRAAALPWAGALALSALERLGLAPHTAKGKRVAICGASSGEGCVLVQLLGAWGAHVTAHAPRHAAQPLRDMGAAEVIEMENSEGHMLWSWRALELAAVQRGPWDAVLACGGPATPANTASHADTAALLKAVAPRSAVLDVRPAPLLSDRLPPPLHVFLAAALYAYRALRWVVGCGSDTDWLEAQCRLRPGLQALTHLVHAGTLTPVLDRVYLPAEYESALAHACSDDALGVTVVRFL